jgi:hypothetical protein
VFFDAVFLAAGYQVFRERVEEGKESELEDTESLSTSRQVRAKQSHRASMVCSIPKYIAMLDACTALGANRSLGSPTQPSEPR